MQLPTQHHSTKLDAGGIDISGSELLPLLYQEFLWIILPLHLLIFINFWQFYTCTQCTLIIFTPLIPGLPLLPAFSQFPDIFVFKNPLTLVALPIFKWVWAPPLEHDPLARAHTHPQKTSIAKCSSARGEGSWTPPHLLLECGSAWSCSWLWQAAAIAMSSWMLRSCHVKRHYLRPVLPYYGS